MSRQKKNRLSVKVSDDKYIQKAYEYLYLIANDIDYRNAYVAEIIQKKLFSKYRMDQLFLRIQVSLRIFIGRKYDTYNGDREETETDKEIDQMLSRMIRLTYRIDPSFVANLADSIQL